MEGLLVFIKVRTKDGYMMVTRGSAFNRTIKQGGRTMKRVMAWFEEKDRATVIMLTVMCIVVVVVISLVIGPTDALLGF